MNVVKAKPNSFVGEASTLPLPPAVETRNSISGTCIYAAKRQSLVGREPLEERGARVKYGGSDTLVNSRKLGIP